MLSAHVNYPLHARILRGTLVIESQLFKKSDFGKFFCENVSIFTFYIVDIFIGLIIVRAIVTGVNYTDDYQNRDIKPFSKHF
jgi:hypothetical protein